MRKSDYRIRNSRNLDKQYNFHYVIIATDQLIQKYYPNNTFLAKIHLFGSVQPLEISCIGTSFQMKQHTLAEIPEKHVYPSFLR